MVTQWRVGPSGAVGLDYTALFPVMALFKIDKKEELEVFDGVRIMEIAVLNHWRENKG